MAQPQRTFAIAGLGRIGGGLALRARSLGWRVLGLDTQPLRDELREAGVEPVADAAAVAARLPSPRVVLLYVPAGPVVDTLIDAFASAFAPGDVVVDGGNSHWRDSQARHARLAGAGIGFVDLG